MVNQIAVLMTEEGKTGTIQDLGQICVFSKVENQWVTGIEIPFDMRSYTGMAAIREGLQKMTNDLGDCKVLVAKEVTGLIYNVFDSKGFNTWEMDGDIEGILEYVYEEELKEVMASDEEDLASRGITFEGPIASNDQGSYTLDLKQFQGKADGLTSKKALLPFLQEGNFYELSLTCTHVPGWLDKELTSLNLDFEAKLVDSNSYLVLVKKKVCQ